MKVFSRLFLLCLWSVCSVLSAGEMDKVEVNLELLDAEGLRGPAEGKVAVAYEFVIPDNAACVAEVKAIDAHIEFMRGASGRIGAGEDQILCIGSTHHPEYRQVLFKLSQLPYVDRIIECHFE